MAILAHSARSTLQQQLGIIDTSTTRTIQGIAVAAYLGPAGGMNIAGGGLAQAMVAGAAGGFVSSNFSVEGAIYGASSGALFYGAGQLAGELGDASSIWGEKGTGRALLHAGAGCISSSMQGGDCGSGAVAAGVTKFVGANTDAWFGNSDLAQSFRWAVIGGTTSALGGGKFANGAMTGAFQYLMNSAVAARAVTMAGTGATAGCLSSSCSKNSNVLSSWSGNPDIDQAVPTSHGNSLDSPRGTTVYKLVSNATNEVMKYGITSADSPESRYSKTFYTTLNVRMEVIATFESRLPARVLEVGLCGTYVVQNGSFPPMSTRC